MDDLISRKSVLDAFDCSIGGVPFDSVQYVIEYADKMMSRISALPSAQPDSIRLNIDHALTEEEIQNLKQKIADSPVVLMPYEKPKIIHCKDCKHHDGARCFRWNSTIITGLDDFCSSAERRQDE